MAPTTLPTQRFSVCNKYLKKEERGKEIKPQIEATQTNYEPAVIPIQNISNQKL